MEEMTFETPSNDFYVLLDESNRIIMVTGLKQDENQFLFSFPTDFNIGNHNQYKIVNNELVYDPIEYPEPEPVTPLEDRVTTLEQENSLLTECVLEMSEILYSE